MLLKKIISGGQTGVDRGALDAAIALGMVHGGWCPQGRQAEDGRIPDCYLLEETDSPDYPVRTERNVLESNATLILYRGQLSGGTLLTFRMAGDHERPCLAVDLDSPIPPGEIRKWFEAHGVEVLNVAGPRESQSPGIGELARDFMLKLLAARKNSPRKRPG
ncbi:MAG: putative molybdenum carrier protein [Thermoguttaceae bacterium]